MSKKANFSGGLNFINLADIFQIFVANSRTGTLRLTGPDGLSGGIIYFVNGNPKNAISGSLSGIDAINKMFGWMDGWFEFFEERVKVEWIINLESMKIILDALRMLDEGTIEKVGNESNSSHLPPSQLSFSKDSIIKGPAIDYAYFLDEEQFSDGEKIVGEGNEGNWLWVIIEGTVRISKDTPNGTVTLNLLGEGSYIGTFTSFEYWKNKRLATATAVGNVCLGVMDSTALYSRYCALSRDFQQLLLGLSARMKKINDQFVAPATHYQPVDNISDKGGRVFEEGNLSQDVLSIIDGEAYLIGKEANTGTILSTLEKGDMIGKLPFCYIGQEPHCATVVASKDLRTQKIDRDHIMKEFIRLPRVLRYMINNVATCVAKTTLDFMSRDSGKHAAGALK